MTDEIRPYIADWRYGILNQDGQLWTCETFNSIEAAEKYKNLKQSEFRSADLSKHKVVPVLVTIEANPS